jgi:hypothetical protein
MRVRVRRVLLNGAAAIIVGGCLAACDSLGPPIVLPKTQTPGIGTHSPQTATTPTSEPSGVTWSISPIDAVFGKDCSCTDYAVTVSVVGPKSSSGDWTVTWTLTLQEIDPAPGAVDSGCNNNGVGTTTPKTHSFSASSHQVERFTWYHPSATDAPPGYPAGIYHCRHSLEGARGHQGIVDAVVVHGVLHCSATYYGTHTGTSSDPGQPGTPSCIKV